MSAPSDAQIGFAKEVTWGQFVAPTKFFPLLTPEMAYTLERLDSEGIVAGLDILGTEQWAQGNLTVGGGCGFELYASEMSLLFEAMFGTMVTTGSGPFTDTFTPTAGELPSLSAQVGHPRPAAGVIPAAHLGCKVASWELGCSQGAIATLGLQLAARNAVYGSRAVADGVTTSASAVITSATAAFSQADVGKLLVASAGVTAGTVLASVQSATNATLSANATATGTAITFTIGATLATATYAAGASKPLTFNHASLMVAGSAVKITEITVSGDNGLKVDRRFLGSGLIDEPLRESPRMYKASFSKEHLDTTSRDRLTNGTEHALVLNFTAGSAQVEVSGNVRYDKADSTPDGKSISKEAIDVRFIRPGSTLAGAITAKIIR